jgi:hypothetical protein
VATAATTPAATAATTSAAATTSTAAAAATTSAAAAAATTALPAAGGAGSGAGGGEASTALVETARASTPRFSVNVSWDFIPQPQHDVFHNTPFTVCLPYIKDGKTPTIMLFHSELNFRKKYGEPLSYVTKIPVGMLYHNYFVDTDKKIFDPATLAMHNRPNNGYELYAPRETGIYLMDLQDPDATTGDE